MPTTGTKVRATVTRRAKELSTLIDRSIGIATHGTNVGAILGVVAILVVVDWGWGDDAILRVATIRTVFVLTKRRVAILRVVKFHEEGHIRG
jgi:hypothetical protein